MKKFIGYIIILAAFIAGYLFWHPLLIPALAFAATLAFANSRRQMNQGSIHHSKPNPFLDGIFLFALQCLIIFFVYNLGLIAGEYIHGQKSS